MPPINTKGNTTFPALSLRKERKWKAEGLRRFCRHPQPPHPLSLSDRPLSLRPPPHLLVSGCTVMLGIGHMVCAENARAGVTLKRQKICRKWVGLQVQRDLDVVPAHSSLPPGEGKRYGTWQRTATQSTASLATPPTPSHALWHFWPWSSPFPQFLAPLPAPPPAGSAPHPLTQALTARLRTVSPQVRKLHRRAGRGCSGGKEREAEQLSGSPSGSEPRAPLLGGGLPVPPLPLPRPARVTGASAPPGPQLPLLPWRERAC